MKCISKKILCYILIGFLTFSVTSTVYYKSVHAMEWVGGALAFEEALKWLLAAIGITATAGMTDAYWDTYGDDFVDYAVENGATQTEVADWQLKACQGVIDKGSEVWTKFKAWASDLVNGSSSGGGNIVNSGLSFPATTNDVVNFLNTTYSSNIPALGNDLVYNFIYGTNSSGIVNFVYLNRLTNVVSRLENNTYYSTPSSSSGGLMYGSATSYRWQSYSNNGWGFGSGFVSDNITIVNGSYNVVSYSSSGSASDSNFEASATNVNDLDVISSDGVDEDNSEVTVPMPGVSDSDNEVSKDAYQDIIDAINDGTITQEQGVEQIQEILKIITYDTVTDEVVPPQQNDDGTDKTKDDALKENKENMGFTLGGLEAVFPFCIPFDIYAFMTLLVAEPECPEFDFPVKSVNGEVEEIHIDLEPFEPVAVVVRYCFDFLFIIGLAMLTRSLIGGGSSD